MRILEVEGLAKRFGGLKAVDDVGFAVEAGAIHGLIGPNGSGKSTTFHLVSGVHRADAGSVRLGGEEVKGLRSDGSSPAGSAAPSRTSSSSTT